MQLSKGSLFKQSVKLAWPISLQGILVTLLGMIDIIMVTHLGDSAVAAVGISNRIAFVVLIVLTGLASGVGVLSSQYFGAGKTSQIKNSVVMATCLSFLALIPIVFLNFFYVNDVLQLASNDPAVVSTAEQYLWITIPSLFFIAIILIFENALRGIGQVKLPMVYSSFAIALNVVLNYWLINGGLGIEPMGVVGAAWATTISRFVHLVILLLSLKLANHSVFPNLQCFNEVNNVAQWLKFTQLVWPMMFSYGVWSLGTFVYQLIYGQIGTKELAVMSLLTPIEGLLISYLFGFSAACSILIGQALGKDDFNRAWHIARSFAFAAPTVTLVLTLLLFQFQQAIFSPFASMDSETILLAKEIFVLVLFGTCLKVYNMTISIGILRAGGDNKYCLLIDFTGMWVVSIPLTFMAAFYFQLPLFWVVVTAYSEEICKAFLFFMRMQRKVWLKNLTST